MIDLKRILCPIDYSEFSRHALDHAISIAQWYGASATALFVLPQVASLIPAGLPGLYPPIVFTTDDLQQFEAHLDAFVAEGGQNARVETVVVEGNIAEEITRLARELPADLLVMGTHGRSGFDRLLLGSVTEKMLRKAPCRVMTVPKRVSGVPNGPIRFSRILCAVDFSPSSLKRWNSRSRWHRKRMPICGSCTCSSRRRCSSRWRWAAAARRRSTRMHPPPR